MAPVTPPTLGEVRGAPCRDFITMIVTSRDQRRVEKVMFTLDRDARAHQPTRLVTKNLDIKPVYYAEGAGRYVTKELKPETSDRLLLPPHTEKKNNIDG